MEARQKARRKRQIARQNRVSLTSFLMENGYKDTSWLSDFWDMSSSTIRDYKKEARHVSLSGKDKKRIKKIQRIRNCELPEAVKEHYKDLTKKEDGGCFIATAAYGTPLHSNLELLRKFRDQKLKKHFLGRLFVNVYYTLSPSLARTIRRNKKLGGMIRFLLRPIINILDKRREEKT